MCSPYLFIRLHTSLLFSSLLIRANTRARKSHNKVNRVWQSENCDVCAEYIITEDFSMDKYIYDDKNGLVV